MKNHLSTRNLVCATLIIAGAAIFLWPTAGISTGIQGEWVATVAAAQANDTCPVGSECLEWCQIIVGNPDPQPSGELCCIPADQPRDQYSSCNRRLRFDGPI